MSAEAFLKAREFLFANRTDYDTAYRDFRWPVLDKFNWALDYFDAFAQGNEAPALWIVDEDENVKGWYRRRLALVPGMTGPWQILGPARVPLQEMGAMDYLYVANWSLWGDLKLLARTLPAVTRGRGCCAARITISNSETTGD